MNNLQIKKKKKELQKELLFIFQSTPGRSFPCSSTSPLLDSQLAWPPPQTWQFAACPLHRGWHRPPPRHRAPRPPNPQHPPRRHQWHWWWWWRCLPVPGCGADPVAPQVPQRHWRWRSKRLGSTATWPFLRKKLGVFGVKLGPQGAGKDEKVGKLHFSWHFPSIIKQRKDKFLGYLDIYLANDNS